MIDNQPQQRLFGCPINLCWWPLVDDIIFHNGKYHFIQGPWVMTIHEGEASGFVVRQARYIANMNFIPRAAYYDTNLNEPILLQKVQGEYHLVAFDLNKFIIKKKTGKILLWEDSSWFVRCACVIDTKLHLIASSNSLNFVNIL